MLRRLGRDFAVYGGSDFVFKLIQFVFIPIYARYLTVAEFGIMALLQVSALLAGALANVGVNYAVQRFYFERAEGQPRQVLVSTGLLQLVFSTILVVSILLFFARAEQVALQRDFALGWPLVAIALLTIVPEQISQYALDASRWQFARIRFIVIALIRNVIGLLLGLWLLTSEHMGLFGLFLGSFVGACLAAVIGTWLVRRDIGITFDLRIARQLFAFGAPFVFSTTAYWAFSSMDRWLLARLSDTVQVGLFSIGVKFASIITLVISAFMLAWVPHAMRMAHEDPLHRIIFARMLSAWFFLLALIGLGLALFAGEILALLTPPSFWPATQVLALVGTASVLSGMAQITSLGVTFGKRPSLIALGAWLAAVVNIGINLVLIPRYGAIGAAVATLGANVALAGFYFACGQRLYPLPLETGQLIYGLLIFGVAVGAALFPAGEPFALVSVSLKVGVIIASVIGAFWVGLLDSSHVRQLRHPVRPDQMPGRNDQ